MRRRLAAVLAAGGLLAAIAIPAAAQASPAHGHRHAATQAAPQVPGYFNIWTSDAGHGDLWMNPNANDLFLSSHSGDTPLNETFGGYCNSAAWCEYILPNGECMAYYASGPLGVDLVDEHACNGDNYELWFQQDTGHTAGNGDELFAFFSYYLTGSTCSGRNQAMTAESSGSPVSMQCPDASNNDLGTDQEWWWSPAS